MIESHSRCRAYQLREIRFAMLKIWLRELYFLWTASCSRRNNF